MLQHFSKRKYGVFIFTMFLCTFEVVYIGWHVPLLLIEPFLFFWSGPNPLHVSVIVFLVMQLLFFILARESMYRRNTATRIVVSLAILYINACIQLVSADTTDGFDLSYNWHRPVNVLTTMPLLLISALYLYDTWKPNDSNHEKENR